jgi:putative ABC transport system permease protein
MESLLQDIRYAARTLLRSPGFTIAAVLMLTLAIGANTALFSVIEEAILAEPPFPEPERLVVLDQTFTPPDGNVRRSRWSYPRYRAFREEARFVENVAGYNSRTMTLTEIGAPTVVAVETVSPSYFPLLGVRAASGRVFTAEEADNGSARMVAIVSDAFWKTKLGASATAVGSTIMLDQKSMLIAGVLPSGFEGITGSAEVWIPFSALREIDNAGMIDDPWNQHFDVLARLAPGASFENALAEMTTFGERIFERWPPPPGASDMIPGGDVVRYSEARVDQSAKLSMFALFGAVVMVLLIATANLAGLMLARGTTRHKEAAIRASLGAGRGRLLRQLLTESLLLALVGGVLGIVFAIVGIDVLGRWLVDGIGSGGGRGMEYLDPDSLSINWKVLSFAILLTAGVGVALGIMPALQAAKADPNTSLKGGQPPGRRAQLRARAGRDGLIVVQVGVALVLLVGASLMMRSMANLQAVDLGYDPDNLLTGIYSLTSEDESAGVVPANFHLGFLERVRALPGVADATLGEVPMGGPTLRTIVMGSDGRPDLTAETHIWVRAQSVADGHFGVLGTKIVEGRDILASDGLDSEPVVVLNEVAAQEFFPDGDAIGRRIRFLNGKFQDPGATVVGIVGTLQLGEPGREIERQAFVPITQRAPLATGLIVRSLIDPEMLGPTIQRTLADAAPHVVLTSAMTMEERTASVTARPRIVTALLSLFGVASLFLVAVGLYGTIAFTVARRTPELGLRASLGADNWSLGMLVLKQGLGVTLLGLAVGLLGAVWATRFLQGLLFGIEGVDAITLITASMGLLLVATLASYLPARKAMRIDPMVALRAD